MQGTQQGQDRGRGPREPPPPPPADLGPHKLGVSLQCGSPAPLKHNKRRSMPLRTPTRQLPHGYTALASCVPLEQEKEGWPLGGLLRRRQQVHTAGLQARWVAQAQAQAAGCVCQ